MYGKGYGFENHIELNLFEPYYATDSLKNISKWAKWRNDGNDYIHKDKCPYCMEHLPSNIGEINDSFSKVFKSSALSTASKVFEHLEMAHKLKFIEKDKIEYIDSLAGVQEKSDELKAELKKLGNEIDYILNKLIRILNFKPINISKDDVKDIDNTIKGLKIDKKYIREYLYTDDIQIFVDNINSRIDTLQSETRQLFGLFNIYQSKFDNVIQNREKDINMFLSIAGFPYKFRIEKDEDNSIITYLVPDSADKMKVLKPQNHLSWGEKNAFSLIMFMFEVISDDVELIVLDDPISSFDKKKKFAVIKRMFNSKQASLFEKTVLMLTHDLQPIIDYVHGNELAKSGTKVSAKYLENQKGNIVEYDIDKLDLINTVTSTCAFAKDSTKKLSTRIVNLRRYIELTNAEYENLEIYQILSNFIHGRQRPLDNNGNVFTSDFVNKGISEINKYIEMSTYDEIIEKLHVNNLYNMLDDCDDYEKIIVIRLIMERKLTLFKELRKTYPICTKFINETNHIEDDYVFQLNPEKYMDIPKVYLDCIYNFIITKEIEILEV